MKQITNTRLTPIIIGLACVFFVPSVSFASPLPDNILLVFPDRVLSLDFQKTPELIKKDLTHKIRILDKEIPLDFAEDLPQNPDQWNIISSSTEVINPPILSHTLEASSVVKDLSDDIVEISQEKEKIIFSSVPDVGYQVEPEKLKILLAEAIAKEKTFIKVPAKKIFSPVKVSEELKQKGIQEVIAIGESNFKGSSLSRRQNIMAGARKFDAHLVPKGETFSFNQVLQSVEEADGFVRELVIKGDETEKELGGGVCQVSTTAFRAAFFGGLPIERRRAHSYAVPYYKPFGLDAAIYLGALDLRFTNDTPGDILIQTFIEGDDIYFVFYGTKDQRKVTFAGPFLSEYKPAPEAIIYETEDLPPGETEELAAEHDGFRAEWIRRVQMTEASPNAAEAFVSVYRPWPARVLRGKNNTSISSPPSRTKKEKKRVSYPAIWESYQRAFQNPNP